MQEELSGTGFVIFGDRVNILQIFQVDNIGCATSHWLPQSAPQLPLVTFETLIWNRKHVMSNLGSLTGVYSHRCLKKVAVTFGCDYLIASAWRTGRSTLMCATLVFYTSICFDTCRYGTCYYMLVPAWTIQFLLFHDSFPTCYFHSCCMLLILQQLGYQLWNIMISEVWRPVSV